MKFVLLVSHGSYSPKTKKEIRILEDSLQKKAGKMVIRHAFLEIASPSITEGIEHCVEDGATEIVVLLNFLNSGKHVDEDIPKIVRTAGQKHPHVKMSVSKPVGQHPAIADLFLDMINS